MNHYHKKYISIHLEILCILMLSLTNFANAQNTPERAPTAKEKVVINKFVNTITPLITPYANENWTLNDGGPDDPNDYSVAVDPGMPLGLAPFTDYEFDMTQGTPLWNKEMKPIMDSLINLTNYGFSSEQLGATNDRLTDRSENTQVVYVAIIPNISGLPLNPVKGNKRDLKIPGCYYSYYLSNDDEGLAVGLHGDQNCRYVLAFGDWSETKLVNSDPTLYGFHFKHPNNTPFIENTVIVLCGNKNRIKQLVQQTDWTKVNAGLTR